MAARNATYKSEPAATTIPVDLELGNHDYDEITPSASYSITPDEPRSKRATPTPRHPDSLEVDDVGTRDRSLRRPRLWMRAEQKVPAPVARWSRKAVKCIRGPSPSRSYRITPLFEGVQALPARLLARLPQWVRVCIFAVAFVLWAIIFAVILTKYGLPADIEGLGAPVRLSCVDNLWYVRLFQTARIRLTTPRPSSQSCGLDGRNCLPFSNLSFAFNCPGDCLGAQVLNPRAIGDTRINYRPLVVGGAIDDANSLRPVYRGDSFICGAAIHAGVISNNGGCGVVSLVGEKSAYGAVTRNGISSVAFDSAFPMAFSFNQSAAIRASDICQDPRWNALALSTVFTALFGLFTSTAAAFFAPVFTITFFQIGMASDPPSYATYPSLASTTIGRFLPAALAAALFYQFSVRKTLQNCKAHIEKTILWVGGMWVGALANYTLEKIPIQRLTGHDIRQQPGAVAALVIIVLVLLAVIIYQVLCFRSEGRLPRYLALYITFGVGLGILAAMPHLTLRIHHYIIALLLLPGTALRTRISLLCQGFLVGLFINGVARWNFDPILQTAAALRGDAQLGSVIPSILEPVINGSSIAFAWQGIARGYEGVSVLVNDVERLRGTGESSFTWTRRAEDLPEYFRFGFVNYLPFGGLMYSDYTRAGTWWTNGTWSGIPAGRT
jgi:hypothetical protein